MKTLNMQVCVLFGFSLLIITDNPNNILIQSISAAPGAKADIRSDKRFPVSSSNKEDISNGESLALRISAVPKAPPPENSVSPEDEFRKREREIERIQREQEEILPPFPSITEPDDGNNDERPLMQIAILLDTSKSMDGLIHQARTQLWKVVNDLASAEEGGDSPLIEVALFEYGNSNLKRADGYVRMLTPFTRDLDQVSDKLFSLTTKGGREWCAQAIHEALSRLAWSEKDGVYRAIFIAGNEPFNQGPKDFRVVLKDANAKKVIVNTIFCGPNQIGKSTNWEGAAGVAGGDYIAIEQNRRVVVLQTPQDKEILKEGRRINDTFIPYGKKGKKARVRQRSVDKKAARYSKSGAAVNRHIFKGTKSYSASADWDLVSLVASGRLKIKDIDRSKLPRKLRKLSDADLERYIRKQILKRKQIQEKIERLSKQRDGYLKKRVVVRKRGVKKEPPSLDEAMSKSIRRQRRR